MTEVQHWALRALRFFTKSEVKTPLSFLFKLLPWLVMSLVIILYAPIADALKWSVFCVMMVGYLVLVAGVLAFAWFKPKNLVYGETGHRAEYKMEFGTEQNVISHDDLDRLVPVSDPRQPLIEKTD